MEKMEGGCSVNKKKSLTRRKQLVAYSFILPNLLGFFIFTFVPIVFSLLLSFCEWNSGGDIKFVGLDNFIQMFTRDKSFWISLKNTIYYTVLTVPKQWDKAEKRYPHPPNCKGWIHKVNIGESL